MHCTRFSLLAAVVLATLHFPLVSRAEGPSGGESLETLVAGNNEFAVKMFHQLGSEEGNLFFSPYSVSSALGMTYAGARGNTAAEMANCLSFSLDPTRQHTTFKALNDELMAAARDSGQKLNIANGLCLTGGDVDKDLKAILKEYYSAELFAGGVDEINGWVNKKTEGKIEKILESLSANSVCVLLNAIYFKGTWQDQFEERFTRQAPFRLTSAEDVDVPLMFRKGNYRLLENESFQAVAMPYEGGKLSMVVLLPRDVDGLKPLTQQLSAESLGQWLADLDKRSAQKIQLYFPKFKLETSYDLVSPCRNLGMKDAFGAANFTGMGWPEGDLWISQIKHKAFVEVNEEGTEAAAATAVEMTTKSAPRPSPVFRVDHPFLFLIRDNQTGSILFMGKMTDPR